MRKIKRALGLFLASALVFNSLNPMLVQAEEATTDEVVVEETIAEEETEELEYWETLGKTETSAYSLNMRSLANGTVELKSSNEVEWIDRLDLSEVPEARTLYDTLVEASDNDGVNDYLIEDTYFAQDTTIPVVTVTGTYEEGETLSAAMNKVYNQYKPFISAVFCAFDRDHPEVFWLDGQWSSGVSASGGGSSYTVRIYFSVRKTYSNGSVFDIRHEDYRSEETIKEAIAARDSDANILLSGAAGKGDYEKIAYFNERLTKINQYNTSSDLNNIAHECRECVGALAGSTGTIGPVCEGYARAFKVLCDRAGINCVLVDGKATNSAGNTEGHMWNYVQLDGAWYAADVTWNDPVPAGGGSGAVSGYETDEWLLVGSDTIVRGSKFIVSHPVENTVSSSVIAFTNGPELNASAYVTPLKTTLSVAAENTILTYGDQLVVKATAVAQGTPATTQKMELYYGETKLAESSKADSKGCYILTYDTAGRDLLVGVRDLTVKFSGGANTSGTVAMTGKEGAVTVTLNPAEPVVAFANAKETIEYNAEEAMITAPDVSLIGADEQTEELKYYYMSGLTNAYIEGLPKFAGTYRIKAVLPASSDGYYAEVNSVNELTLTITKKVLNITALDQEITYGEAIEEGLDCVVVTDGNLEEGGLVGSDELKSIQLVASTEEVTEDGSISVTDAVIVDGTANATENYEIHYHSGKLIVKPLSFEDAAVEIETPEEGWVYTGEEIEPEVTVKYEDTELMEGKDYTVEYSDHVNAGTASVTVSGIGNYAGTQEKTFEIEKKTLQLTLAASDKYYDGTTKASIQVKAMEGAADGDEISLTIAGNFESKDAGEDIVIHVGNPVITGEDAVNYKVETADTLTANIYPKQIKITADGCSKVYGEEDPELSYTIDEDTPLAEDETLTGVLEREAGENVGTYEIKAGSLTTEQNPNYDITFETAVFTIDPAGYNVTVKEEQVVILGKGQFTEPQFTGVNDETVDGTLTYTYEEEEFTYSLLINQLASLDADQEVTITYSFVPDPDGNYTGEKSGEFILSIRDVVFYVGNEIADLNNAVTLKENPVYGDSWDEIVTINEIKAVLGDKEDDETSHFTLNVSGNPDAGKQKFEVIYNGTIDESVYENIVVCSGTAEVAKLELQWDVSNLSAYGREGKEEAFLYGAIDVEGILAADQEDVTLAYGLDGIEGVFEKSTSGKRFVSLYWIEDTKLQGKKAANYELAEELPEIVGTINEVSEEELLFENASEDIQYKLVIEKGISEVPEAFEENADLNTPDKISEEMMRKVQTQDEQIDIENILVYDINLLININQSGWEKVGEEDFPEDGITVTLPYPEGTDEEAYDFTVVHVFAEDMNGYMAGEEEYPELTETEEGIEFTIYGLSPVGIGWKAVDHKLICPSLKYADISMNAWYHSYVDYVAATGLMMGTAENKFSPNKTTSRAMIVTVLYRMAGLPQAGSAAGFTDIESNSWYEAPVAWAAENGIVKGTTETTFDPNGNITREQLAAMLYRYADWANENKASDVDLTVRGDISKYNDADEISNYAIGNMEWAVGVGLFKGDNKNMLNPKETATRAEVATTFQRLCEEVL